MPDIVTLTVNPTIDKSTSVDSVASEVKMRCAMPTFDPGGGGLNVSRAIKKLGGTSTAIYTAGGGTGAMLTTLLQQEAINTLPIAIADRTRENLTVYEESTGLQYRFGMPGPNVTESEWQGCLDAVLAAEADYIVASGSLAPRMPQDFYMQLAERVKPTKSHLIVDTSNEALEACARAGVFLLKPNLRELEILSGQKFSSEDRLIEITQDLIKSGMTEVFVISMGASGALFITADEAVKMRPPVVPIRSKVGAGDSMVGGIVWALAEGHSLHDAVRYGIAAGSAAVMTRGTELCRKDDVFNIYDRIAIVD
ncbi:MAG: 1-phosphofructokinase family hexose kinase [Anaerolineae bacterium]|nr:1-phosphofructokinase family hexose kinase [Anaerolineae bacterium]